MAYWLYNLLLTVGLILVIPLVPVFFLLRMRVTDGWAQRLGFYPSSVLGIMAGSRPIWVHAVSVGEVLATGSLVREIRKAFPQYKILMSSATATGVQMATRMDAVDAAIFFPLDYPAIVRRALRVFDPRLIIFLETEIWPNFLALAHRRGVPVLLLSGRISARSARRYRRFPWIFGPAVRRFEVLGMQTEEDAGRMFSVGVDRNLVVVTGNLKYDAGDVSNGGGQASAFVPEMLRRRPLWVAGSTHEGEEGFVLEVHAALQRRFDGLVLILAPRHPHRFTEVEELLRQKGVCYVKKSRLEDQGAFVPDVVLLDSMGELPAFYALAQAAFVGGSLVGVGGHNVLEPARLKKPVFFGPHMENFAEAAAEIDRKGGGAVVRTQEELVHQVGKVLADPALARAMGDLAHGVVDRHRGVVRASMRLVSRYLG